MYIRQGRHLPLIYDVHWIYVNSPQFLADGWSRQHVLVARREKERKDKIRWYRCASKHRIDHIVKSEEAGMLNEPLSNAVFLCQLVSLINIFASSRISLAVRFSFLSVARSFSLSLSAFLFLVRLSKHTGAEWTRKHPRSLVRHRVTIGPMVSPDRLHISMDVSGRPWHLYVCLDWCSTWNRWDASLLSWPCPIQVMDTKETEKRRDRRPASIDLTS